MVFVIASEECAELPEECIIPALSFGKYTRALNIQIFHYNQMQVFQGMKLLRHPKKLSKRLLVKHWIVIAYAVSCCLLPKQTPYDLLTWFVYR